MVAPDQPSAAPHQAHRAKLILGSCETASPLASRFYEVAEGFCDGARAIARAKFCLRLFEVAADGFFAEANGTPFLGMTHPTTHARP